MTGYPLHTSTMPLTISKAKAGDTQFGHPTQITVRLDGRSGPMAIGSIDQPGEELKSSITLAMRGKSDGQQGTKE